MLQIFKLKVSSVLWDWLLCLRLRIGTLNFSFKNLITVKIFFYFVELTNIFWYSRKSFQHNTAANRENLHSEIPYRIFTSSEIEWFRMWVLKLSLYKEGKIPILESNSSFLDHCMHMCLSINFCNFMCLQVRK